MKRLVVIDGKSVFYRGYYAMPSLSTRDGIPTGGVYGFAALSLEVIKKLKPDYVAIAWDKPKTNIRARIALYPAYKAGRKPAPPDFYAQIPLLQELLEAFGWPLYELDDYEADDIMGALADQASRKGIETCLITSDLDALQLIGERTHVYAMKKGFSQIEEFNLESFEKKYGLKQEQFLDLKALKGDSSDNIPGVPGVGEKTAVTLLQEHKTLDGVYDHLSEIKPTLQVKLQAGKESAYLSKKIARIWIDAPVKLDLKETDVNKCDPANLARVLQKLEFRSLLKNLPEHMQQYVQDPGATSNSSIEKMKVDDWSTGKVAAGKQVALWYQAAEDELWLAEKTGPVYRYPLVSLKKETEKELEKLLTKSEIQIIGHDIKPLLKRLLKDDIFLENIHHDTAQGAFLLDSLRRDRQLENLLSEPIDMNDPAVIMPALWQVYEEQIAKYKTLPKLYKLATEIDFALISILARMEYFGVKIEPKFFESMSKQLATDLDKLQKETYTLVGYEFNIGSPAQLADVLYGKLQLPTAGIKKGKTGFSTGQKELDKLRGQHPIIELIEKTRELAKLKNTYVDTLPKLVDKDNRLHTTFNQDIAPTGRLNSIDPNLQNIPIRSDIGRKIREGFIADKGNMLVSADYSQFELRLTAVLAGDDQLIEDFNGDIDIHTKTASDVYGVPLDKVTKNQRRDAKVINFGILYGMSPHGLAAATGMTFAAAKEFITEYFALRAPIKKYIDSLVEKAENDGYVETLFGRRRPTPDVKSNNFIVREAAKRAAMNMPIQGTEADLMKLAMLEVDKKLMKDGTQLLQIHDSILVECPEKNAKNIAAMLKDTMENIYPSLGVKLKVDVSIGKNWGEL